MRKKRVVAREEQQRARREKRRNPFKSTTKLIELVDKRHYGDIVKLIECLSPYLLTGERGPFMLTRLYFDLDKLVYQRQFVYDELAIFLKKVKDENGLSVTQSVFFRYLSSPDHCNLGISENSLKALILEAMRRNS